VLGLVKRFGPARAVDNVSFEFPPGSFVTLLAPSGCGKTTTLRLIAGLERPDPGLIEVDGEVLVSAPKGRFLPPEKRKTGMVFQSYAVWPHMTVYDNIAYPLMKEAKEKRDEMVRWAISLVRLEGLERRHPSQLSGGQQQRVVLARALVGKPRVLLLDEPLSNLDARLRVLMRGELKELQRKLNLTTIYVTHDQVEALSLSDRIFLMHNGKIVQEGTPEEIFFKPTTRFAAEFVGYTNLLEARIVDYEPIEGFSIVESQLGRLRCLNPQYQQKSEVILAIRPENIRICAGQMEKMFNVLKGKVIRRQFVGEFVDVVIDVGGVALNAHFFADTHMSVGEGKELQIYLPPESCILIPR